MEANTKSRKRVRVLGPEKPTVTHLVPSVSMEEPPAGSGMDEEALLGARVHQEPTGGSLRNRGSSCSPAPTAAGPGGSERTWVRGRGSSAGGTALRHAGTTEPEPEPGRGARSRAASRTRWPRRRCPPLLPRTCSGRCLDLFVQTVLVARGTVL